jgi:hypothetical protein
VISDSREGVFVQLWQWAAGQVKLKLQKELVFVRNHGVKFLPSSGM